MLKLAWCAALALSLAAPVQAGTPIAGGTSITVVRGSSYPFYLIDLISGTDSASGLTYVVVSQPLHGGTVKNTYTSGFTYYKTYISSVGYSGTDRFTWQAYDTTGTSNVATVSINCIDPASPVATSNSGTVAQGAVTEIPLDQSTTWASGTSTSLSYEIVTPPQHGTWAQDAYSPYRVTYRADIAYTGTDRFTWRAFDSGTLVTSATVNCTISVLRNTPPVVARLSGTVQSGTTLAFTNLSLYVTEPAVDAGQTLSFGVGSAPAHGFAYRALTFPDGQENLYYVPDKDFAGTDTFTWVANDGIDTSVPATVTVTVTSSAPVPQVQTAVTIKNTAVTIYPQYTGGGGYSLTMVKTVNPTHGTVSTDGTTFIYAPALNYTGSDSFKWNISYNGSTSATGTCSILVKDTAATSDWTQWRYDECRTAQSPATAPRQLYLQWRRDLPVPPVRMMTGLPPGIDCTYVSTVDYPRPVQLGKGLFVPSAANDRVTAYDTDSGSELWRYYASGAVRRPPAAVTLSSGSAVVIFGSDDGWVYCVNALDGTERWRRLLAPNTKKAMGFGRLSSIWPVLASPVIYGGKVYCVAGFLPSALLFGYCLDADTGTVVWKNDGRLVGAGWNSAIGPLAFSFDHTKVFGSVPGKGRPWVLDPLTGELTGYTGSGAGKAIQPFRWYMDGGGSNSVEEPQQIVAGGQTLSQQDVALQLGIRERAPFSTILAGDGKVFASGTNGSIYCLGGANVTPVIYPLTTTPLTSQNDVWTQAVQRMLSREDLKQGLALVWGVGTGRIVEELALQAPNLQIVAADPDPVKLQALRMKMDAAGLSGVRVSTVQGNPVECGFAPNQAALIASEDLAAAGFTSGTALVKLLYDSARPYGGEIWLPSTTAENQSISSWLANADLPTCSGGASFSVALESGFAGLPKDGFTRIRRLGLPDSRMAMRQPYRYYAFGIRSFLIGSSLDVTAPMLDGTGAVPSQGVKEGCDLYSWLPLSTPGPGYEPTALAPDNVRRDKGTQPTKAQSLYAWNSRYNRTEMAPSIFAGGGASCSGWVEYGSFALVPGKVANFTDQFSYRGVQLIPEVGACGAEGIAGDGMMALECHWGCTCNKDLDSIQLGLMPTNDPGDENWVNYLSNRTTIPVDELPFRHIGINFGALGDRYDVGADFGWTHHPVQALMGESTPWTSVTYSGSARSRYHYSGQMPDASGTRGWVSASSVVGLTGMTIPLARPLIATRITQTPAVDGTLSEACWNDANRVLFPFSPANSLGAVQSVAADFIGNNCYVMVRYDDTNLYIAGGLHAQRPWDTSPWPAYIRIGLNSRDQQAPLVYLFLGESGKVSQGIGTSVWQSGYKKTTSGEAFTAEIAIPWSALAALGIWKEQLIMNAEIVGSILNGSSVEGTGPLFSTTPSGHVISCFSPVYLDTARGPVAETKKHTVRLFFTEMDGMTAGQRVFDVKLQGQTVLPGFDVAATAGPMKEVMREFKDVPISDHLDIDFTPSAGEAMISGVEILRTEADSPNQSPVPILDLSATSGPAPLAVNFSARRSNDPDGQILQALTETGDGRIGRLCSFDHVFAEPGTYKVNLLVVDNRGCTATTGTTITVTAGVPAAFVSAIRASGSGGDYTSISAWNTALAGDLTSNATFFQVSNKQTYASSDMGLPVTFQGGGTGTLQWLDTTKMVAAVTGTAGTINTGAVTISSGHTFLISNTGSTGRQLLFTVGSRGTYAATDDGTAVTFTGGGQGTLRHINGSNIAYIGGCRGTIQAGTITCASGHTFTVSDTGNPIYTMIAEGYNDWASGLIDSGTLTGAGGWVTDPNHCVVIRPAPGHGHNGMEKIGTKYSGFGLASGRTLTTTNVPHTRIERIITSGAGLINIGLLSSVNRVVGSVAVTGNYTTVANSVGQNFRDIPLWFGTVGYPATFLNCTGSTFALASSIKYQVRTLNCLAYGTGTNGYRCAPTESYDPSREYWLSRCVSADSSAASFDSWAQGNEGNLANATFTFRNVATGDYGLALTDAGAVGRAQPGLGADVVGNPRLGPTYDAGAFQTSGSGKPFTLTGSVLAPGKVSLVWNCNPSSGESGYRAEVSTNGGATFSPIASGLPLSPTSLVTSDLPALTGTQKFRVIAFNGAGDTIQSPVVSLVPFTAKEAWFAAHGLPPDGSGNGAWDASPAGDGIANLLKYALDIDPNTSGYQGRWSSASVRMSGTDFLSMTYTIPEPAPANISYAAESAVSLSGSWSSGNVVVLSSTVSGSLRTVTVRDGAPMQSNPRGFLRLRISTW